jgi:hypothetical protein
MENISINAAIVFDVIMKLTTHTQIQKTEFEDNIYTVLYRNMILIQIKHFKISTSTLSKAIKELEDVDLIECINKNTTPAYRLLPKADGYNFLPKEGEFDTDANKPKKQQKQQLLSLGKKTRLDKTTPEYKNLLKEKAKEHSEKNNIDFQETFQSFVDYHTAKGTSFVNWFSAYKTWCRNKIKWDEKNNPNGGENGGLYS